MNENHNEEADSGQEPDAILEQVNLEQELSEEELKSMLDEAENDDKEEKSDAPLNGGQDHQQGEELEVDTELEVRTEEQDAEKAKEESATEASNSAEYTNKIHGSQGVVVHDTEITPDGMEFYQPPDMPLANSGTIEQQPFIRKSYAKTLFIIMLLLAGLVVYALFFDKEGKVIDWFEQLKGLVPGIQ
jgi:hypothetical protein